MDREQCKKVLFQSGIGKEYVTTIMEAFEREGLIASENSPTSLNDTLVFDDVMPAIQPLKSAESTASGNDEQRGLLAKLVKHIVFGLLFEPGTSTPKA